MMLDLIPFCRAEAADLLPPRRFSWRRGGGRFFFRLVSHTDGLVEIDHLNKGQLFGRSTRGLLANHLRGINDHGR